MNILILGGTGFLGPHTVRAALAAGHTVTLFNRGKSNSTLFPEVETLHGDRDPLKSDGINALRGREWDAAIDICGYVPRLVSASAELLADSVGHYVFVSTISVYSDLSQRAIDENSPVGTIADPAVEKITGETYGPLKVLCEQAVEKAMPGRAVHIRPGLIVGPGDTTDRFTYWPVRIARGGEVLAPGEPGDRVQIIDARDLAQFMVHTAEEKIVGVMNAVGPKTPFTFEEMLTGCQAVTGSDAKLVWVTSEFLMAQGVKPWSGIPLWVPDTPDMRGFAEMSNMKAIAAGLEYRPFEETARDTLAWSKNQRGDQPLKAGLTVERERQLLDAWTS